MAIVGDQNLKKVLREWGEETKWTLKNNMRTQHIFPNLVYPKYKQINELHKKQGSWYSTGKGEKSFRYKVLNATPGEARIDFFFLDYLRYVDLGVGRGRKVEDVQRTRKARYKSRYAKWYTQKGDTHRPAFMMEFRHLQRRMAWWMMEKYGYEGRAYIMGAFSDMLKDPQGRNI